MTKLFWILNVELVGNMSMNSSELIKICPRKWILLYTYFKKMNMESQNNKKREAQWFRKLKTLLHYLLRERLRFGSSLISHSTNHFILSRSGVKVKYRLKLKLQNVMTKKLFCCYWDWAQSFWVAGP